MYKGLYEGLYEGLYKVCLASEDEYMKKATIAVTESELSTLYPLRATRPVCSWLEKNI